MWLQRIKTEGASWGRKDLRGPSPLWAALMGLYAAMTCACVPAPIQHDVILITIDGLRVDTIGDAPTPNLSQWAAAALRFTDATTPMPSTTPALGSVMTGLWPGHHGARSPGQPLRAGRPLAAALNEGGYFTLGVSASPQASQAQGLATGFDRFHSTTAVGEAGHQEAIEHASRGIDEAPAEAPLFVWVHLNGPRFPYGDEACLASGRAGSQGDGLHRSPSAACLGAYRAAAGRVDAALGALMRPLASRPSPDAAYAIIATTGGESLGEGGLLYGRGPSVHPASSSVFLALRGPGIPAERASTPASLEDIPPTLLPLVGLDPGATDGLNLLDPAPALRPTFTEGTLPDDLSVHGALIARSAEGFLSFTDGQLILEQGPQGARLLRRDGPTGAPIPLEDPAAAQRLATLAQRWQPDAARLRAAHFGDTHITFAPSPQGGFDALNTPDPKHAATVNAHLKLWARSLPESPLPRPLEQALQAAPTLTGGRP